MDMETALSILPGVQKPENRKKLEDWIRARDPAFMGGTQANLESLVGPAQETDVTELRGKQGAVPGSQQGGEGGSGGALGTGPSGDGGSGMAPGNVPDLEQQLAQTQLDLDAINRAQANLANKQPPAWNPPRPLGLADRIPRSMGGNVTHYTEPSMQMFRAELAVRAKGLEQHARAAQEALQTQSGAMAPEAMMELQGVVQGYRQALQDASDAGSIRPDSPAFREWRDQKWAEAVAQHQQQPDAGPLIRTDEAPTDSFMEKLGWAHQKSTEALNAVIPSAIESATIGLATGPLDQAMGEEGRKARDNSPIADMIGGALGFMTPGSLAGRLATGTYKLGSKTLGKVLGGAAAGAGTTALEGTIGDLSHDYLGGQGEERFNNPDTGMSESDKLAARLGFGGLFGAGSGLLDVGGEAIKRGAKNSIAKSDMEAKLTGRGRADSEAMGFRPKLTGGIETPPAAKALAEEAVARGTSVEDVIAREVGPDMADASAKRMATTGGELARIRSEYGATQVGQNHRVSAAPMVRELDNELARMTQSTGQPMVGAQRKAVEAERWKLFDPTPVGVVPRHQAQAATMKTPGAVVLDDAAYRASPLADPNVTVPDGHVVILQPNRMRALELEDQIDRLQFTLKPGQNAAPEGQTVEAFKGLDRAAREMRDQFPWPDEWAGRPRPTETIELADGNKITLKDWSAMIRKAGRERAAAENTRDLVGLKSDLPFSRQKAAGHQEPFLNKLKNFPGASEAEKNAMLSLTDKPEALRMLSAIVEARKLRPGSSATATLGASGPRLAGFVGSGRGSNALRALLLKLAKEPAPTPVSDSLFGGLAPLRGGSRLIAGGGAYNRDQANDDKITTDSLLRELTEEDLQIIEGLLKGSSQKGMN